MSNFHETVDERFWQEGVAGGANIVCYNGEDIRGVAFVADEQQRKQLIERHNSVVRQLLESEHQDR